MTWILPSVSLGLRCTLRAGGWWGGPPLGGLVSAPAPGEGGSLKGLARWRADQCYALGEAWQTLGAQPLGTTLIALTLALALLLPAALGRVLALTEGNLAHWPTTPRINVFFDRPEPPATLLVRWRAHPEIAALEVQSSEASRTEFLAALGMETALSRGLAGRLCRPCPRWSSSPRASKPRARPA